MLVIPVDSNFLSAVLSECRSCLCFFSGVVSLISSQNHIPFRRSFSCNQQNKKADTQRHQKSAGALLSLQNDVLCNGFEIQRRDCLFICSLADSTKKHRVQTAVFSLSIPQALDGLHRILNRNILYLVVVLFHKGFYYIKTIAENQVFGKILYSFCKSRAYYFVTLSVERPVIGKYMLK